MPGYCGRCNKHYSESGQEHELECDEGFNPANIQGTMENFDKERIQNNWDDEYAEKIWDKYYK